MKQTKQLPPVSYENNIKIYNTIYVYIYIE